MSSKNKPNYRNSTAILLSESSQTNFNRIGIKIMDLKRSKNEPYEDEIESQEAFPKTPSTLKKRKIISSSSSETSDNESSEEKTAFRQSSNDQSSKSVKRKRPRNELEEDELESYKLHYGGNSFAKSTVETPSKRQKISITESAEGFPGTKNTKNDNGDKLNIENLSADNLKILIYFLWHIPDEYSIAFATDTDEAGNSDNIVFRYKEANGKLVYRFLQIEHKKHANDQAITVDDLLGEMLKKHFNFFRKATRNPLFEGHEMKDYVICTNADMVPDLKSNFTTIGGNDKLLSFGMRATDLECLKLDDVSKKNFVSVLANTSKCKRLAEMLAMYVHNGEVIDFRNDLFEEYHRAIRKYVIEPENVQGDKDEIIKVKFRTDFLEGKLPEQVKNFRNDFYEAYKDISGVHISKHDFWTVDMKNARPKIHQFYRTYLKLDDDLMLTDYIKLAEFIAEGLRLFRDIDAKILIERRTNLIKENIDKLAGYVFIKKDTSEKDIYYFSSTFVHGQCELPRDLQYFRNHLIKELREMAFDENICKYKFQIKNFTTCPEAVVYSKSDFTYDDNDTDEAYEKEINNFFEKLVFAINQRGSPNGKETDKYFNFSHNNARTHSLHKYILDWIKAKKACFQDHLERKLFTKETYTLISNLVVLDSMEKYCAELESTNIEFIDNLSELRGFLNSKEEQIFNLVSAPNTTQTNLIKHLQNSKKIKGNKSDASIATKLSAIKVMQTLKNIQGSFIFMPMCSILPVHDYVMHNFRSTASSNVMVIECEDKKKNRWKLFHQLCSIMENNSDKKIIIITQKDNILTEAFQDNFSGTMKYKEIKDKKSRAVIKN